MKTEAENDIHGYLDGALSRRELWGRPTGGGAEMTRTVFAGMETTQNPMARSA